MIERLISAQAMTFNSNMLRKTPSRCFGNDLDARWAGLTWQIRLIGFTDIPRNPDRQYIDHIFSVFLPAQRMIGLIEQQKAFRLARKLKNALAVLYIDNCVCRAVKHEQDVIQIGGDTILVILVEVVQKLLSHLKWPACVIQDCAEQVAEIEVRGETEMEIVGRLTECGDHRHGQALSHLLRRRQSNNFAEAMVNEHLWCSMMLTLVIRRVNHVRKVGRKICVRDIALAVPKAGEVET
jgi:hypothetical protein